MGDTARLAVRVPRRARLLAFAGLLAALAALAGGGLTFGDAEAQQAPGTPQGLAAIALDGQVGLAWKASSGATSYAAVPRDDVRRAITTLVTPAGYTGTTYTDTGRTNGTTYLLRGPSIVEWDRVRADSRSCRRRPVASSCVNGHRDSYRELLPGHDGLEDRAGATRVRAAASRATRRRRASTRASSVDLHVSTATGTRRTTSRSTAPADYGGTQGRLVSARSPGCTASWQPGCSQGARHDRPDRLRRLGHRRRRSRPRSHVAVGRLPAQARPRRQRHLQRDPARRPRRTAALRRALTACRPTTYQAYNGYGGKSLYDWN